MILEYVDCVIENCIAIVMIKNPPVNSLSSIVNSELLETFYRLDRNVKIKVVILTADGDKAFAAGADIKEFVELNNTTGPIYSERNNSIREYIRTFPKPVICAINGIAYGAGLVLSLFCDIRLAVKNAKFNMGEINMGILGGTQPVGRMLHSGIARKMIYTGTPIDANEAYIAGLIDEIVDKDELMPRAMELALLITKKPPLSVKYAKQCMLKTYDSNLNEGCEYEYKVLSALWNTEDKNEAVFSFLNKKDPVYNGK